MEPEKDYRISGHESFPCRYTWLPKAVQGLSHDPKLFSDEENAMVNLGVGKNMVRSIRFWAQMSGMTMTGAKESGHIPTECGQLIFGDGGLDPFLEDIPTLWLIHWNLSTNVQNALLDMKPRRIHLKTRKGWKMPASTVSVAPPSKWANQYAWWARGGYSAAAEMYRDYIVRSPRLIEHAQRDLCGKNLACRCPINEHCHADILLELVNAPH